MKLDRSGAFTGSDLLTVPADNSGTEVSCKAFKVEPKPENAMKTRILAVAGVMLLAIAGVMLATQQGEVEAQARGYEYAYVVAVPRLESYEIDFSRWAGSTEDKQYIESHVFVYEEGASHFDRQVNSLRKINELADKGWELYDAEAGVMRRSK